MDCVRILHGARFRQLWLHVLGVVVWANISWAEPSARPNIVVFLMDDHSQLDSAVYGSKDMPTPNMVRLAKRGLTFENAFVASPSCAPSRAALLTGLMPARNGAEANHSHPRAEIKKWPAYFQELGYEVVAFGKVAHYQQTKEYGFDYFAHDTFHDHECIPAAVEYLKHRDRGSTRPLCIMVGTNWPHVPWPKETQGIDAAALRLPAKSVDTTTTRKFRAEYAAAVVKADEDLGMIYDAAHEMLTSNTIFLESSDHGAQWPFAKWNCYDSGLRVPLIIKWPGVIKPGSRTDAIVSWIDFLPTLLEAVGGKAPEGIDGESFVGLLRGTATKHRNKIYATHTGDGRWNVYPMRCVRTEGWKYILNLHPDFAFTSFIDLPGELTQREMWMSWVDAAKSDSEAALNVKRYHKRPAEELYDLAADPNEESNMAGKPEQQNRLTQMREDIRQWMRSQDDKSTVTAKPRLLNDPTSYGAGARTSK